MHSTLHITNGDGAAGLLKASGLPGDVLPWRDPMHHGPFPHEPDLTVLSEIRGRYLAGPDIPLADVVRDFELRNQHFQGAARYDEVVLWFEHDLLDQLQILQILSLVASAYTVPQHLSMVCIDQFEGVETFRGLGQLSPAQIGTLWPRREPVTRDQLTLAAQGWSAFCSDDPQNLERFMEQDLGALPFLGPALRRHLEDYPHAASGLTRTEAQILGLVAEGVHSPVSLFVRNMDLEDALFLGDWPTFTRINLLCSGPNPLLHCAPDGVFHHPPSETFPADKFAAQTLHLTEIGKEVASGLRSAHDLLVRDDWLGGVHLNSEDAMWVWDSSRQRLVLREP